MSQVRRIGPLMKITEVEENSPEKVQDVSLQIVSPVSSMIRDFDKSTISLKECMESDTNNSNLRLGLVYERRVSQGRNGMVWGDRDFPVLEESGDVCYGFELLERL
ncbi:M-phase inducer phosphatase-like isoform X1 [Vespula squamosa]|uniref:M-phase inducer phosphatase-like isoform X1 n=1 Tax=Vespula squamosa TaxID=30214 RepID=A0ABD2BY05_VESSQ